MSTSGRGSFHRGDTGAPLSRRRFLGTTTAAAGALALGGRARAEEEETPTLPRAVLGRTGEEVSILGLGTALMGHRNHNRPELPPLVDVFGEAIDRGISYVDTARIYGRAEEALARVLRSRREKVFLATKVWAETYDEAKELFETSLRTLEVDHVDLLHLHHAGGKDIDRVLGPRGSWDYLLDAKREGTTRFIGITGHARPDRFVRMLETDTVDVMMVAMNFVDRHIYGFEEKVLPVARERGTGVLAMKVYGGVTGGFKNYAKPKPHPSQMDGEHHERSVRYAKTLEGVTGMVIGVHDRAQLLQNIRRAADARPLSREEFDALVAEGKEIARGWTPRFGPVS